MPACQARTAEGFGGRNRNLQLLYWLAKQVERKSLLRPEGTPSHRSRIMATDKKEDLRGPPFCIDPRKNIIPAMKTTITPSPDHEESTTPRLECDLVMKGGITSGVVYPTAVLRLAANMTFGLLEAPPPEPLRRRYRRRTIRSGFRRYGKAGRAWHGARPGWSASRSI